ncbi:MAG: hypothetical protein UW96_C0020G0010 [Candidatus Collierbacteria bacterium GW2011_GWA1_45_15]|nr:MAG: hypothetical protein UW96_C0020G0010 [Candidatus Collierbacteria bacterium GW2011_GWA1_45_15]HCX26139.1 hypothetical protein [Candidatus Collierbacteria bacterium]
MSLKNLGSFLLALWADLWRFVFPNSKYQPQKEATMPIFFTPEQLKEKLQDRAFQLEMVYWLESTIRPLENDALYLMVAHNRASTVRPIDTACIQAVLDRLEAYILLGTPAHELGHHIFDALGGSAIISNDPFVAKAYQNEIDAALFGAMFHDNATGVQHRYIDNEWELNHGELAAWIFYHATEGLLIEPVRRLTAYAIAAHPHMTKEMTAKNGSVRKPWRDQIFTFGKTPVRLAVWITRWTDRLENGGDSATHFVRHALATIDGARVGGLDLHGVDWYNFNDQLKYIFTPKAIVTEIPVLDQDKKPVMKDNKPVVNKVPSMLQHLKGYASSALAFPYSAYNQHDHRSSVMTDLMSWKVANSVKFIDLVSNTTGIPNFELFIQLMQMKSGSPNSQLTTDTIKMMLDLWNLNTPEDQAHWAQGFQMALTSYYEWLQVLQNQISKATDPTVKAFQPLVPGLIARVTKI